MALIGLFLPALLRFLVFDAVWSAPNGDLCRAPGAGACWAFIGQKLPYFTYGSYPLAERWRVDVTLIIGAGLIVWLLWLDASRRLTAAILFFGVYPILSFILLHGAPWAGLPRVDSDLWGGIFVSLLVAIVGIVVSLPLGNSPRARASFGLARAQHRLRELHRDRARRPDDHGPVHG
ncbi:General L-amino acid transport system permease protein AapM (fragment) [Methylocella tundrae]|uniref:General L-amino acid transport system permease protein AapM n=1 Tax=Methylocella tundrae TaxID=227605 RepID=A0A4U8Z495_METTU